MQLYLSSYTSTESSNLNGITINNNDSSELTPLTVNIIGDNRPEQQVKGKTVNVNTLFLQQSWINSMEYSLGYYKSLIYYR